MAENSTKVIYSALVGNALVAASKYAAAAVSGSSAMLTEAIHSTADICNQIVLLIGNGRSRAAPDETHEFGYGMEVYFWASLVGVMVLTAGGVASLYEGVVHIRDPQPIGSPRLSLGILALSVLFEGSTFVIGYRQYTRVAASHAIPGVKVGLLRFIDWSKDPNLYESLLEDGAALIGLAVAATGIVASAYFHLLWADGAASILIGLLLVADAIVILAATRSLVAGETVAKPLRADIERTLQQLDQGALQVVKISTLHLGPQSILIALKVDLSFGASASELSSDFTRVRESLRAVDPRITHVLIQSM